MKYLKEFLAPFQTAILGTLGENGYPFNSYAPFYYDGESIYIFISDIATHAKNIQTIPKVSVLFIEDESISTNMFRRKRISLQCNANLIKRDTPLFTSIMPSFIEKQGDTLKMLLAMRDFNLYTLKPIYGEATFGFGEAYLVGGEQMNQLLPRSSKTTHQ